jgi:hypothetical protein
MGKKKKQPFLKKSNSRTFVLVHKPVCEQMNATVPCEDGLTEREDTTDRVFVEVTVSKENPIVQQPLYLLLTYTHM